MGSLCITDLDFADDLNFGDSESQISSSLELFMDEAEKLGLILNWGNGAHEILDLATMYNLDAITLAVQWMDLLSELIADPLFVGHKHVLGPVKQN